MSDSKHFDKIAIIGVILAIAFTLWFMFGAGNILTPMSEEDNEYLTDEQIDDILASSDATIITLNGDSGEVDGSGASVSFGSVSISDGGIYRISGTLSDGNIDVKAGGTDTVYIVLDGADISCSDDSAVLVENADKVYLISADGSENSLYTGADMESSVEATAAGREGCIYARDDLILAGRGTVNITSDYEHGVVQDDNEDTIIVMSGTYSITSVGKGIKSDGTLEVTGGNVTIDAQDDAIHTDDDITLTAGVLTLSSADDGIHSDTAVYLNGTDIEVLTAYEGVEALIIEMNDGDVKITSTDDGFNGNGESTEDTLVTINGGTLTVLNPTGMDADGIDSNGSIVINGGYVYVSLTGGGTNSALDYGSENGGTCTINGGTVIAAGGSGMLEEISDQSAQGSITMVYETTYEAGTTVTVTDADGNEIISQIVDDTMSAVTLSAEAITEGGTYTVTTGTDSEEVTLDSIAYSNSELSGGMMGGGFGGGGGGMRGGMGGQNSGGDQSQDGGQDFGGDQSQDGGQNFGGKGFNSDSEDGSQNFRGGRGRMMQQNDNSSESTDTDSQKPDMSQMQDGEMPDMSQMQNGDQMGGMPGGGGMQGGEWDMDNQENQVTWYTPTTTDWIYIGIGVAVLVAAIIFAAVFKRRKRK